MALTGMVLIALPLSGIMRVPNIWGVQVLEFRYK